MSGNVRVAKVALDKVAFHPHNIRRDLGDLRPLADSIRRYGLMQPIVVEQYGDQLRLRAGHRRLAAARVAGLRTLPAIIHDEALEDDEWLIASVQENIQRRGIDTEERARAVDALRDLGCTWEGIGDAFGVAAHTARAWSTQRQGPDHVTERMDYDRARVAEKVRQGRSNTQIADELGMGEKRVERLRAQACPPAQRAPQQQSRAQSYVLAKSTLRQVCAAWRDTNGKATVADLLDALERLADTGRAEDAAPDQMARQRRRRRPA